MAVNKIEYFGEVLMDVTGTTAAQADVLNGKVFTAADGTSTTGSMPNIGKQTSTMDGIDITSVAISKGYHDGTGTVSVTGAVENARTAIRTSIVSKGVTVPTTAKINELSAYVDEIVIDDPSTYVSVYSGSTEPASSLGNNGDLYFKM